MSPPRILIIGSCCVAVAAGGTTPAVVYWPSPNPTPQTIPAPSPGNASPVIGNQNEYSFDAEAQLPTFPEATSVDGADALRYVSYLRWLIPGTNWYLSIADQVANCAITDNTCWMSLDK